MYQNLLKTSKSCFTASIVDVLAHLKMQSKHHEIIQIVQNSITKFEIMIVR